MRTGKFQGWQLNNKPTNNRSVDRKNQQNIKQLSLVLVDCEKAFDSVEYKAVFNSYARIE